jgi:hypothetical protein
MYDTEINIDTAILAKEAGFNIGCTKLRGEVDDYTIVNDCKNATSTKIDQIIKDGFIEKFKMFDDDGELYYSGYAKPDADFDPLDDFGTPNAGCTEIQYYNNKTKKYETL